jgi:uncharacterized protein involved in type VI secretion and phage assembly
MAEYAKFKIKVNGAEIQEDIRDDVMEIVVDSNLHLPSMVVLQLFDEDLAWVDDSRFDLGKAIEISVSDVVIFQGEITSIEPDFAETGRATLLIRGYDKSHRLHRGRKTQTFLQQKDSDIISKIASGAGLSATADATTAMNEYVIQNNQTDMEFILSRASRLGYHVYMDGDKLMFKKGETVTDGPDLTWGESLRSFRPRWSGTHQVSQFKVYGWDGLDKVAIVGEATPESVWQQGGMSKSGGAAADSAFNGAQTMSIVNQPVITKDEATALATAVSHEVSSQFVQAEGVCFGDPKVTAGKKINVKGVGTRFSGKYYVTAATHVYREGRYETNFTISGQLPNTINQLVGGGGNLQGSGKVQGPMVGVVTNLNDPNNLGRIKVKFPTLGENIESTWARVASPMAGTERGLLYLPEVNDEVLIDFELGDMHRPYMVGALWNSKDKPPLPSSTAVASGKVVQRMIKTRAGHVIILDDTQGAEKMIIRDKTTKNEIIIESATNTMTINMDKDINVNAKGNMNFKATGDIKMECANMEIQTNANYKVNAMANIDMIATTNGTYKANAIGMIEGKTSLTLTSGAAEVLMSTPSVTINKGALMVS